MMLERGSIRLKAEVIANSYNNNLEVLAAIIESMRSYLSLKTVISLITGVFIWLWLLVFGIEYALLWGLIAFMLNYIPNIGSIIAGIPAVLFALVQLGLPGAGWTLLGFFIVNMVVGNVIEPRMMGKEMGLSTLIVFLSLVFWGFILGTIGMFLAVPLTMTFKIILDQYPKTKWISILLGSDEHALELAQETEDEFNEELIEETSKTYHKSVDKLRSTLSGQIPFLNNITNDRGKNIAYLKSSLAELIKNNNVIYHGLAGHLFTKDIPYILKIRITANIDYRINVVMKRDNVSNEKARELLNKVDIERSKWSLYLYGIDSRSSELFDVVMHIDCLKVNGTLDMLYDLAKRPCFQTTPESKKKLKDMLIAAKGYAAIVDKYPDARVKCKDGSVLITVESSLSVEKKLSRNFENLLKDIEGVKEVKTFVIPFET